MKIQRRNFLRVYFLSILVMAGTLNFLAGLALAEIVTFNFTGTITAVSSARPHGLRAKVGDLVTGSIAYDMSLPPAYDNGSVAGYIQPPPSGMSVVIGKSTIQSAGDASLQVLNNAYGVDNINGYLTPISVNGQNQPGGSMGFYLGDTSQTAFSNTASPDTLDVNSFNIRSGGISAGADTVSFSIDTLLAVGQNCTTRPLSDFLNAQGQTSGFFGDVPNYVGWIDGTFPNFTTFALVDYAGLANKYLAQNRHPLGTKVRGLVVECELPNNKAQVRVTLFTTRALGFAMSKADLEANNYDFPSTPTIFGAKVQDVLDGAKAAVGPVTFKINFTINSGDSLPDLLDVINGDHPENYAPASSNFRSTTFGRCSNGKKGRLDVYQVAHNNDGNGWVYSVEEVNVVDVDGGNCVPQP